MKKKVLIFCLIGFIFPCMANETPRLGKSPVGEVVKAMTLEEKASLLVGTGMPGFSGNAAVVGETQSLVAGAAGTTYGIDRLGIPAIVVADGPAGLRISPTRAGEQQTYFCTAFPVGTLLSSTWNTSIVEEVGIAMGNEVLEYGVDVLLGPALNIQRNPLCGRNFEYYSEDPILSGKITAAIVKGIQKNGVGTSIKHFAANNQETNRMGNDVRITTRALREIYLKGFEIAVKESSPYTVMSSYNAINGTLASESHELLTDILRGEWGFKGIVMTDWFGGKNPDAQVHAGNDLLMPGTPVQAKAIVDAVNSGKLSIADVDRNVTKILNFIIETPRFKGYKYSNKPDLKGHAAVTRRSATEGMVLLKNDGSLPFSKQIKKVAAFGVTSYDFVSGGTGSGDVNEAYTISLKEGLNNAGYDLYDELVSLYDKYILDENEKNKPEPGNMAAMFMPKTRPAELIHSSALLKKTAGESDIAIITIGRTSGEFMDRNLNGDFNLSENEIRLIKDVSETFHAAGKKAIVILNTGGVIETSSWKNIPDAILLAWQAGQEGGNSVADILKGEVNPSGKLPMTFPVNYADAASSANFPQDYVFDMRNLMGNQDATPKAPVRNIDYTYYEEDIYVGYRYFDTFNKNVSYPFGYGLSYTEFSYDKPTVSESGGIYTFRCTVTNTGKAGGKEVVQLYIAAPAKDMNKPKKELKTFSKTKLLQPNESQVIELKVSIKDLASYNDRENQWIVEKGDYSILTGTSSADIKLRQGFNIPKEIVVEKSKNVLAPKEEIKKIR